MTTKLMHKGQRGFTLIELLIVIAITGLITTGLTTTIMQTLTMSYRTSNRMTAVRQVQQAGFWVSPDVMMANTMNATPGSGLPFTLTWTEIIGSTSDTHTVTYALTPMPSSTLNILQRTHVDPYRNSNTTTTVAEYISSASFVQLPSGVGGVGYDFTVTATVGEQSENRTYEVKPRPGP